VEGIGIRTGKWWQSLYLLCDSVNVNHMILMSFGQNNDGIDIDGVTNFRATNCWIGCGDDGFGWHALDAKANGEPPTQNCMAEDCLIYNEHAGNGLRVGASMETDLFKDITFRNIEIITHVNAGIRSDHSDWATFKNIRFENFYIHKPSRPIEIRIEKTGYSNSNGYRDERGHIDGLYFDDVTSMGGRIVLEGYDENHLIKNVKFKDCYNGGEKVSDLDMIHINEFVKNISFE
ncbi:MAG: glycosyl hydrolase family 28 protein, partial [Carboxylicivirga sp.]|nr:glycosyl hydrolase family 28 protein [Carboxylicivirga sp.]